MISWKIIVHSLFLLRHNFKEAFRVFAPLGAAMGLGLYIGGPDLIRSLHSGFTAQGSMHHVMLLVCTFFAIWAAVAWHRFVLLQERGGAFPAFHPRLMVVYFGKSLLVLGCALFACVIIGFVVIAYSRQVDVLFFAGMATAWATGLWLFYRLSPVLPAAAMGHPMRLEQAWRATAGKSAALFLVGLLLMVCHLLGSAAVIIFFAEIHRLVGAGLFVMVQLISLTWGLCILTTIYGVTVEGREI